MTRTAVSTVAMAVIRTTAVMVTAMMTAMTT
jgi:hypothetical protein